MGSGHQDSGGTDTPARAAIASAAAEPATAPSNSGQTRGRSGQRIQ